MNNQLTELVFILDRSGSMHGLEKDTLGGFNSMMEKQKKGEGNALVTTVLFDTEIDVLHDRLPLKSVRPMTEEDYVAGGCTALLDAVGSTIHRIGTVHKYARPEDVPAHTLVVIITDGEENSSRFYDYEDVRHMVEREKSKYGWEFIFLGANIDAVEVADRFGISADRAANYHADSEGTQLNYEVVSEAICSLRASKSINTDWKDRIDNDYKGRKKS